MPCAASCAFGKHWAFEAFFLSCVLIKFVLFLSKLLLSKFTEPTTDGTFDLWLKEKPLDTGVLSGFAGYEPNLAHPPLLAPMDHRRRRQRSREVERARQDGREGGVVGGHREELEIGAADRRLHQLLDEH